VLLKSFIKFVV